MKIALEKYRIKFLAALGISLILLSIFYIYNFIDINHITSISSNYFMSCYSTSDGTLYATGLNSDGQMGNTNEVYNAEHRLIKTPTGVKKVVCSLNSILYIDNNNEVYIIGVYKNKDSKVYRTHVPLKIKELKNISDIQAGEMHFLALDFAGNVWSWGEDEYKQLGRDTASDRWVPQKIRDLSNVSLIRCGFYSSCAIADGVAYFWGENNCKLSYS